MSLELSLFSGIAWSYLSGKIDLAELRMKEVTLLL